MGATTTIDGLTGLVGSELGVGDWLEISQSRVNLFADATDDHQWIHVDSARAAAGPFGGPIDGYLTLSLLVPLFGQVLTVTDAGMGVNYGLNKARFPAPVPVGSKIPASRRPGGRGRGAGRNTGHRGLPRGDQGGGKPGLHRAGSVQVPARLTARSPPA